MEHDRFCHICSSNSGERRISPTATILNGNYWKVEHAYPTSLLGWIVIVLQRHCEELHNLSHVEWQELATIQFNLLGSMKDILPTSREYLACFAEKEGFKHIHFHLVPKTAAFSEQYSGSKSFRYINPEPDEIISLTDLTELCDALRLELSRRRSSEAETPSRGLHSKGLT